MLSASSLLGAFVRAPPLATAPAPSVPPPPPPPASEAKTLATAEFSADGTGAGLPSKNLANRDDRPPPPPPRPCSAASTGERAAGDGEPRPGGARAIPRSSKMDLLCGGGGGGAAASVVTGDSSVSIGSPLARKSRSRSRFSRSFICALNTCMPSSPPLPPPAPAPPAPAAGLYVSSSRWRPPRPPFESAGRFPRDVVSSGEARAFPSASKDILPEAGASIQAGDEPEPEPPPPSLLSDASSSIHAGRPVRAPKAPPSRRDAGDSFAAAPWWLLAASRFSRSAVTRRNGGIVSTRTRTSTSTRGRGTRDAGRTFSRHPDVPPTALVRRSESAPGVSLRLRVERVQGRAGAGAGALALSATARRRVGFASPSSRVPPRRLFEAVARPRRAVPSVAVSVACAVWRGGSRGGGGGGSGGSGALSALQVGSRVLVVVVAREGCERSPRAPVSNDCSGGGIGVTGQASVDAEPAKVCERGRVGGVQAPRGPVRVGRPVAMRRSRVQGPARLRWRRGWKHFAARVCASHAREGSTSVRRGRRRRRRGQTPPPPLLPTKKK